MLRLANLPGREAARAHTNVPAIALGGDNMNTPQIRQPAAPSLVVGMTHVLPERGALRANVANPSHRVFLLP